MTHRAWRVATGVVAVLAVMGGSAFAQNAIGSAPLAANDVRGSSPARRIAAGTDVFRNERVQTGADSAARLVFLDNTNVSLGPVSSITLDRFVYSGGDSAQAVGLNLARGAFRFATGSSDKRAYDIKTPVATIGVRGTILDILSEGNRTTVRLVEGEATVCVRRPTARNAARRCASLLNVGDVVVVTPAGASNSASAWNFAQICRRGGAFSGLCDRTQFAARMTDNLDDVLCGR